LQSNPLLGTVDLLVVWRLAGASPEGSHQQRLPSRRLIEQPLLVIEVLHSQQREQPFETDAYREREAGIRRAEQHLCPDNAVGAA
jgi:hypothetical protein